MRRIAQKTVKGEGPKACWVFTGHLNAAGFACVSYHGKPRLAHRVVAEETKQLMASWQIVTHTCGTRACVRPDHLAVHDKRPPVPPGKSKAAKMLARGKVLLTYTLPGKGKNKRRKRVRRWVSKSYAQRIEAQRAPKEYRCAHCDTLMARVYTRNKYCSPKCVNAAYYVAHPDPVLPPCRVCGGPVPYRRKIHLQKTMCSKTCRHTFFTEHLRGVRPKARVRTRLCVICVAPYTVRHNLAVNTCQKRCAALLQWRRRRGQCLVCSQTLGSAPCEKEPVCTGKCTTELHRRVAIAVS